MQRVSLQPHALRLRGDACGLASAPVRPSLGRRPARSMPTLVQHICLNPALSALNHFRSVGYQLCLRAPPISSMMSAPCAGWHHRCPRCCAIVDLMSSTITRVVAETLHRAAHVMSFTGVAPPWRKPRVPTAGPPRRPPRIAYALAESSSVRDV